MSAQADSELDQQLRLYTYRTVVETTRVPKLAEAARELSRSREEVRAAYTRLSESHAIMLDGERGELWRVAPFSAVPTAFPVTMGGKTWSANCIWDALGIPAMLGGDAQIPASCACCNQQLPVEVQAGRVIGEGVIHVAVPAREWYKDVVFT
jgi:hypothetical protein